MRSKKQSQVSNKSANTQPTAKNVHLSKSEQLDTLLQRAEIDPQSLTPGDMQQLQRTIGNQALGQLLTQTGQPPLMQKKEAHPGLPSHLQAGVENPSQSPMNAVTVHHNAPQSVQMYSEQARKLAAALGVGLVVATAIIYLAPASLVTAVISGSVTQVAIALGTLSGLAERYFGYFYNWLLKDPRLDGYLQYLDRVYASLTIDAAPLGDDRELDRLFYDLYSEDRGQTGFTARPSGHDWRNHIDDFRFYLPGNVVTDWQEQKYDFIHFINRDHERGGRYYDTFDRSQKKRIALNADPDNALDTIEYVANHIVSQSFVDSAKITWESRDYQRRLDPIVIYYYDDTGKRTSWIQNQLNTVPKRPGTPPGLTPLEPGLATAPQQGGSFGTRISQALVGEWEGEALPSKSTFVGRSLDALNRAGLL